MGRIDIKNFGSAVTMPDSLDNSPLAQAYGDVWGSSFEKIESIELGLIQHYQDENGNVQPFHLDEEKVEQIMKSASDIGIITPLILRKCNNGKYQILAGHHRYEAAKRLKLLSAPCVIRNISDEDVVKVVVESNIQRTKILPSEYGKMFSAYMGMKKEIDMTTKEIAEKFGVSAKTMYRYVNVTKLLFSLQQYVDIGTIQLKSVDILSTFSEENQTFVLCLIEDKTISKLTIEIAKKLAEVVDESDGTVMLSKFTDALKPKPKARYKNSIYNKLSSRYQFEFDEKELDNITAELLEKYFKERI